MQSRVSEHEELREEEINCCISEIDEMLSLLV